MNLILVFLLFFFSRSLSNPQCLENPPVLLNTNNGGVGSVEEIGGIKSYVSGPDTSNRAVLLISDVYGYEAPNLRKLADKVGAAGFYAVVPDLMHGDPYNASDPKKPLPVWKQLHPPDKAAEDALPIFAALRSKGISAIGAAGFCWGGKVAVIQASSDDIQAAVLLHPSNVTVEDMKGVRKPIAIFAAEFDNGTPPALLKQFEETLKSNVPKVDSFVKIFPGVKHGWTIRYNPEDEKAVKSAEEAHQDMLNWFIKHLY